MKQNLLAIKERARLILLLWIIPHNKYSKCSNCKGAVKGLTKLLQNNQQPNQLPQIPQFVPQTGPKGIQENVISLLLLKEEEVVEVATGVEVVEEEVEVD